MYLLEIHSHYINMLMYVIYPIQTSTFLIHHIFYEIFNHILYHRAIEWEAINMT